jgi:Membrane protein involved in the export of O-antigen and teichoic acid
MSRTTNAIRNITYAIVGQGLALIIGFISRIVFIHILGAEYLGINGLFTNILSILSLAEMGFGTAIVYTMYKPLAERDNYKLRALMNLYKNAYIIIGIIIAIVGAALTPFLSFFIKEIPNVPYIQLIYLMFVANSSISYFYSYKRSLIIADQKKHIDTFYRYFFYFLLNIAQIVILLFTKNYILFIGLQIISTFIENVCISKKVDKLYPFLKERGKTKLDKEEKNIIGRNVKAMVYHKIGGIVVMGTDNILISKFVGVIQVGIYSNYLLIINALNSILGLAFQSITASIGNLGVTETNEKGLFIFECINFIGFWIYASVSICLINLINPFIRLWLGSDYLFPMPLVIIIIVSFYLTGMRKSVLTFRDALGLFWYDRYKSIFEAAINLVVSILLAQKIGVAGVFIGTIISTLTTCFWVEPYILFKYGFKTSAIPYFERYIKFSLFLLFVGGITWLICTIFPDGSFMGFIYRLLVSAVVPNIIFLVVFWRCKEYKYLLSIIKNRLNKGSTQMIS